MKWLFATLILALIHAPARGADFMYDEEVVAEAAGQDKPRKTVRRIHVQGRLQRVDRRIEATGELARALQKRGESLDSATILRLDTGQVYELDNEAQTYVQQQLPPARPAAKPIVEDPNAPVISFQVQELPDSTRLHGKRCRRVAAELRARYYEPGTRKFRKENRYLYMAWVTDDVAGYDEIRKFKDEQARKTSYSSLLGGGVEQLRGVVDDVDELAQELEALKGFPMESTLSVYTGPQDKKKQKKIFKLTRTVTHLTYPPPLYQRFQPAREFQKLEQ